MLTDQRWPVLLRCRASIMTEHSCRCIRCSYATAITILAGGGTNPTGIPTTWISGGILLLDGCHPLLSHRCSDRCMHPTVMRFPLQQLARWHPTPGLYGNHLPRTGSFHDFCTGEITSRYGSSADVVSIDFPTACYCRCFIEPECRPGQLPSPAGLA